MTMKEITRLTSVTKLTTEQIEGLSAPGIATVKGLFPAEWEAYQKALKALEVPVSRPNVVPEVKAPVVEVKEASDEVPAVSDTPSPSKEVSHPKSVDDVVAKDEHHNHAHAVSEVKRAGRPKGGKNGN